MEYVYAAMLLHSAEKEIDDDAVTAVLKAAGVDVDAARVKALVAAASADAAPAAEEAEEEEEEEGGFEGLGSLFG